MSEIRQRALETAIAPGPVLFGHAHDELLNLLRDAGAAQLLSLLAAVKLVGDSTFVPAHEGIWRGEGGKLFEVLAAQWVGQGSETAPFSIAEPQAACCELCFENAILFLEVGDDVLLRPIDPTGDRRDEHVQAHGHASG